MLVHGVDGFHFILGELEVEDVDIILNPVFVRGFGDDGDISLNQPAKTDLYGCFMVLLADMGQYFPI